MPPELSTNLDQGIGFSKTKLWMITVIRIWNWGGGGKAEWTENIEEVESHRLALIAWEQLWDVIIRAIRSFQVTLRLDYIIICVILYHKMKKISANGGMSWTQNRNCYKNNGISYEKLNYAFLRVGKRRQFSVVNDPGKARQERHVTKQPHGDLENQRLYPIGKYVLCWLNQVSWQRRLANDGWSAHMMKSCGSAFSGKPVILLQWCNGGLGLMCLRHLWYCQSVKWALSKIICTWVSPVHR